MNCNKLKRWDRVFHIKFGWGIVKNIKNDIIDIKFMEEVLRFDLKELIENSELFYHKNINEPTKIFNLKSSLDSMVIERFKENDDNYVIAYHHQTKDFVVINYKTTYIPLLFYFKDLNQIAKMIKCLKYYEITEDEYVEAYKECFQECYENILNFKFF